MIIKSGNAVLVALYAPMSCSTHAMHELSKKAGGCTILEGKGEWLHSQEWAVEQVRKYEWVFTKLEKPALDIARELGMAFLNDNPNEVEALCTVQANGKTIYVRCTREEI